MSIRLLLIIVTCIIPLWASAGSGTILVFGDSLSAAYGMPVQRGWVALLEQRLAREELPYRIVNASISGDTTASARARLAGTLETHRPRLVVLELGGNDGLRGLSLEAMERNLAAMIETIRGSGAEVLLVGVRLPPNYGPRYTDAFHAVYGQLAERYGVALVPSLVDGIGTDPGLMQADGIHPNEHAQPRIADRVWQALRTMLTRLSATIL